MKRKILSFLGMTILLSLIAVGMAFAADPTSNEFAKKVNEITGNVRLAATVIIALSAVITAIMYMMSSVNPKMKDNAKAALLGLIIGIIVLVLSDDIGKMIAGLVGESLPDAGTPKTL